MPSRRLLALAASSIVLCFISQANAEEPKNEIQQAFSDAFASSGSSTNLTGAISKLYRELDHDNNGIEQSEIDLVAKVKQAQLRAQTISQLLRHDLDGDGTVTRDEVEATLSTQMGRYQRRTDAASKQRFKRQMTQRVDKFFAQDPNNDGRIEPAEYSKLQPRRGYASAHDRYSAQRKFAELLLSKDPNGDGKLLEVEALKILLTGLGDADIDKLLTRKRAQTNRPAPANCKAPAASQSAEVVMVGVYEGSAVPSVAVGGQDRSSSTAQVVIDEGDKPLYVLLTSYDTMIWRFTGAVNRIERVVVGGRTNRKTAKVTGGVTGIAADRVSFLQSPKCLPYFSKPSAIKHAQAKALAKKLAGKAVNNSFGTYSLHKLTLPSNQTVSAKADSAVEGLNLGGKDAKAYGPAITALSQAKGSSAQWRSLLRFNPGGVVALLAKDVVSNQPAENYKVLPQESGLLQLVATGLLEPTGRNEFKVSGQISYPAGLGGAHGVKFLLNAGVPIPQGNPGHSCVFSVDKGEFIEGHCR